MPIKSRKKPNSLLKISEFIPIATAEPASAPAMPPMLIHSAVL